MSQTKESWIEISLESPSQLSDPLANFLEELGTEGVFQEELLPETFNGLPDAPRQRETIKAYFSHTTDIADTLQKLDRYLASLGELFPEFDPPSYTTAPVVNTDWAERWKKFFKPLRISKNIVIKPTWERYTPEGGEIVIDIDPGMAFGTGQHASTRLCVNALEDIILKNRPADGWQILDVGTGTGILAMCCVRLGADHAVAIDLDRQAVEIAAVNVAINDLAASIDIENRDAADMTGSFNLIVANLTTPSLLTLRETLRSLIVPGGYIVASGITDMSVREIEDAFTSDGDISIQGRLSEKEWVCLTFWKKDYSGVDSENISSGHEPQQ